MQLGFAIGVLVVTAKDLYSVPDLNDAFSVALAAGDPASGTSNPRAGAEAKAAAARATVAAQRAAGEFDATGDICFISPPSLNYWTLGDWSINTSSSYCYGAFAMGGVSILFSLLMALFLVRRLQCLVVLPDAGWMAAACCLLAAASRGAHTRMPPHLLCPLLTHPPRIPPARPPARCSASPATAAAAWAPGCTARLASA